MPLSPWRGEAAGERGWRVETGRGGKHSDRDLPAYFNLTALSEVTFSEIPGRFSWDPDQIVPFKAGLQGATQTSQKVFV